MSRIGFSLDLTVQDYRHYCLGGIDKGVLLSQS